jgi:hypothetical protein
MSTTSYFRIGADIPEKTRHLLLRRFPPSFRNIHCRTITQAFRVTGEYRFPDRPLNVAVYGYHRGDGHEALLVSVNGHKLRPDGNRYFICLSVADGEEPVRAAEIDSDSITLLDAEIPLTGLTFKRFPIWKREPEVKKAA